ncbi:hypothetical protein [Labilibaculum sp.]|uniref:SLOG domain-containing protein n=1 Tax=Labilibaculum sp. TaxID=2060723 RepID=UPI002AA85ACC|nr:hypothetical protein [Labilibaculum sp.]
MATSELKNIFLSASIPIQERHQKYINTADIIAIRDAVIALVTTVIPDHRLIWGGHPSITPLINYVMGKLDLDIQEHVKLYQSKFFEHLFPEDNNKFKNIVFTENLGKPEESVELMRNIMFSENDFAAAVFIGGMEGIEDEYKIFKDYHPDALLLPIASTGAATKIVYEDFLQTHLKDERLLNDYAYTMLFKELLLNKI